MSVQTKQALIVSITSDIGTALGRRLVSLGWGVAGTYRTQSPALDDLARLNVPLVRCDLADRYSVVRAGNELLQRSNPWDLLVLCAGNLDPVGPFLRTDFDDWEASIAGNFIGQMRMVHALLASRNGAAEHGPCVLFFAGGGSNSAPVNYSAYTVAKIALTKMVELLDAEQPDTRFAIVGPGWVRTKIHEATLAAKENAGENYQKTVGKLRGNDCTPIEEVVACCEWIMGSPREVVGGRNFSVVFDRWGSSELTTLLEADTNVYKLRRYGNGILTKSG